MWGLEREPEAAREVRRRFDLVITGLFLLDIPDRRAVRHGFALRRRSCDCCRSRVSCVVTLSGGLGRCHPVETDIWSHRRGSARLPPSPAQWKSVPFRYLGIPTGAQGGRAVRARLLPLFPLPLVVVVAASRLSSIARGHDHDKAARSERHRRRRRHRPSTPLPTAVTSPRRWHPASRVRPSRPRSPRPLGSTTVSGSGCSAPRSPR